MKRSDIKKTRFERELPEGYTLKKHINAKSRRVGLIMNLVGLAVMAAVVLAMYFLAVEAHTTEALCYFVAVGCLLALVPIFIYTVAHELVHGWVYRRLTGERLTFGLTWSCAFCGVPGIFVYKRAAMIAIIAPFAVFGVIIGALAVGFFALAHGMGSVFMLYIYAMMSTLLGAHLGGCVGDIYLFAVLLFKYRGKKVLVRDTGPEQFIYALDDTVVEQ